MIGHIVRKELLVNLLSLRFAIGLVVVTVMMGLVGYILTEDYAARNQTYLSLVQEHRKALEQTKVYSAVEVVIDIPPSLLSVFSQGIKDVPSSVSVSPYHVPSLIDESAGRVSINLSGSSNRRVNPLMRIFTPIDLTFVISTIFSLFAVLLVFDGFSGEREQGTLKLVLSSSLGRIQLLMGKFLGALVSLAIPLTLGFLEILLLWSLSPKVSLRPPDAISLVLVYVFSLIFLSAILALGMLISLFAKESSSGFMYLLLAWVVIAVIIPAGWGYLADSMRPKGLREKILRETEQARREFEKTYSTIEYRQQSDWMNARTDLFGAEAILGMTENEVAHRVEFNKKVFPLKFRFAEQRSRVIESYAVALTKWGRLRDNLMRPSPCVLYGNIMKAIAGTNIDSFEDVVRRGRFYREAMMAYLGPKLGSAEWFTRALEYPDVQPTEQNRSYWQGLIEKQGERAVEKILSWNRVTPLSLNTMPPPHVAFSSLGERLRQVMVDGLLLLGSVVLFMALSVRRVIRYPVC